MSKWCRQNDKQYKPWSVWSRSMLFAKTCLKTYDFILFAATEIQNIQIADGDVCRGLSIPIFMIFPRLFTCPTLTTNNFKVGKWFCKCFQLITDLQCIEIQFPEISSIAYYRNSPKFLDRQVLANNVDTKEQSDQCLHCLPFHLHVFYFVCLFVLRLNVPVNNFSVMSGRSHRFLGN